LSAAQWLADRGWGRAREILQIAGEATAEERLAILQRLTESERETLRTMLTRALDAPATAPPHREEGPDADARAEPAAAEIGPRPSAAPPPEHPELAEPAPEFPRLPPGPTPLA
jgi:hypothetical protein